MEKCIVTQSRLLIVRIHWEFTINTFHEKLFWFHTRVLYSAPRKPIILLVNYDSCWQHQMSVRSLRHDRPSGRFSKSRGLSASVSFLSSPPLPSPLFYLRHFSRGFDSRSSSFVPAPHGNACYAGYIFSSAPSNPHWTQRIHLPPLHCRLSKNVIITVKFLWSSGLFLQQENSAISVAADNWITPYAFLTVRD